MIRFFVLAVILLSAPVLYAQEGSDFHRHEIRIAFGDASVTSAVWLEKDVSFTNISFSYFYRSEKYFWIGVNFMNYVGEKTYYNWREYDVNGSFKDFTESKRKYCAIFAPEFRFSFVNKNPVILYTAFSGGVGFENGYDTQRQKYPKTLFPCLHLTLFGLSANLGKNNNIFLGGELGVGFKGLGSIHGGFRF